MAKSIAWWSFLVAGLLTVAALTFFVLRQPILSTGASLLVIALVLTAIFAKDFDFEVSDAALLLSGFVFNALILSPCAFYPAIRDGDSVIVRPFAGDIVDGFACLPIGLLAWIVYLVVRLRHSTFLMTSVVLFGLGQLLLAVLSYLVNSQVVADVNRWP